jgi:hypothetical protein
VQRDSGSHRPARSSAVVRGEREQVQRAHSEQLEQRIGVARKIKLSHAHGERRGWRQLAHRVIVEKPNPARPIGRSPEADDTDRTRITAATRPLRVSRQYGWQTEQDGQSGTRSEWPYDPDNIDYKQILRRSRALRNQSHRVQLKAARPYYPRDCARSDPANPTTTISAVLRVAARKQAPPDSRNRTPVL